MGNQRALRGHSCDVEETISDSHLPCAVLSKEAKYGDGALSNRRGGESRPDAAAARQLVRGYHTIALHHPIGVKAQGDLVRVGEDVIEPVVEAHKRRGGRVRLV